MRKEVKTVYSFYDGDIVVSVNVPGFVAIRHNGVWKHTDSLNNARMSDAEVENRLEGELYAYVTNRYGQDDGENLW